MRFMVALATLLLAACATDTGTQIVEPGARQTARERISGPCEPPACRVVRHGDRRNGEQAPPPEGPG